MRPGGLRPTVLLIGAALACATVFAGVALLAGSGGGALLPGMQGTGYAALDRPQTADEAASLATLRGDARAAAAGGRILGDDAAGHRFVIDGDRDRVCLYVLHGDAEAAGACGSGEHARRDGLWSKADFGGGTRLVVLTPDALRDATIDATAPPEWRGPNVAVFASQRGERERVRFYKRGGGEVIIRTPDEP